MVYTNEDLRKMQAWSFERKVQVTQTRIIEYYMHYGGKVYVSFSGGKDSTVLLDIARKIFPEIEAMYLDTGLEYPEIREFVGTFENVAWRKPKMRFDEVIKTYGYPVISKEISLAIRYAKKGSKWAINRMNGLNPDGTESTFKKANIKYKYLLDAPFLISDVCCQIMKKDPAKLFEKETGKHPIIGTMASEGGQRASGYKKSGCNSFNKVRAISVPMGFWTEQDVLQYLTRYKIPYCDKIYGNIITNSKGMLEVTGVRRSGCMFCCFGCHLEKPKNRFQKMKKTHPKQWEYIMRPLEENGLGFKKVLDFINVKYE